MRDLNEIRNHIKKNKVKLISSSAQSALDNSHDPEFILKAMIECMKTVGKSFSEGKLFLSEMQQSARTMRKRTGLLRLL